MKILVIEKEVPGVADDAYSPFLKAEAARVWELYQSEIVREVYFRKDWPGAVLVLECSDVDYARRVLDTLPLVRQHLIDFDIMPLAPYPGFARLFAQPEKEDPTRPPA